jgi:predicted ATPase
MLDEAAPLLEKELAAQLATFRYHAQVFVLPPWQAIYVNDAARDQSFADAVRIHALITRWCQHCGYATIEVPRLNVGERADFVVQVLVETAA